MDDWLDLPDQPDFELPDQPGNTGYGPINLSDLPDQPAPSNNRGYMDYARDTLGGLGDLQRIMSSDPEQYERGVGAWKGLWEGGISPYLGGLGSGIMGMGKMFFTPPQQIAQEVGQDIGIKYATGELSTPYQIGREAGKQLVGIDIGGSWPEIAAGATLGLAMHKLGGVGKEPIPREAAPPVPREAGPFRQIPTPYEPTTLGGRPIVEPEFTAQGNLFDLPPEAEQMGLPLGAYRGTRGRFTKEGPGLPPRFGPEVGTGDLQRAFDFGEPPPSREVQPNLFDTPPTPPTTPDVSPMWAPRATESPFIGTPPEQPNLRLPANVPPEVSPNGQIVTLPNPDAAQVAMLKNQGYVPFSGRSPEGYVQMIKGDVAPLYATGDKRLPTPEPTPVIDRPEVRTAMGPGEVAATENPRIPNEKVSTGFIQEMAKGGYIPVSKDATHTIFREMTPNERARAGNQAGSLNISEIWEDLKRMLGRDPTPEEVQTTIKDRESVNFVPDYGLYNQPNPADVNTGIPPPTIPEGVQPANVVQRPPTPEMEGSATISGYDPAQDVPHLTEGMTNWPPGSNQFVSPPPQPESVMRQPGLFNEPIMARRAPQMQVPETGGLDVGAMRQQSLFGPKPPQMDPRMAARVEAGGPRTFDFTQPPPEQGNLLPMEVAPPREAPQPQPQPVPAQEHPMLPEFRQSLGRQLSSYIKTGLGDSPIVKTIKDVAKRFLEDETGSISDDATNQIREAIDRLLGRGVISGEAADALRARLANNDIREIDFTQDPARARAIAEFWEDRLTNATPEERPHVESMLMRANERVNELMPVESRPTRTRTLNEDLTEVNNAHESQFNDLLNYWDNQAEQLARGTDESATRHAEMVAERVRERMDDLHADQSEIRDANARNLRSLYDYWSEESRIATGRSQRDYARRMTDRVRERYRDITGTEIESSLGQVEVFNVGDGNTIERFNTEQEALSWIARQPEPGQYDYDTVPSQTPVRTITSEVRPQPQPTQAPLTRKPKLVETTETTHDVPNPPITFGKQVVDKNFKISRDAINELLDSTDPFKVRKAGETTVRPETQRARGGWDDWADDQLKRVPNGEPGLSIEDMSYPNSYPGMTKRYRVVFRDSEGKPVTMAEVKENGHTGTRTVPTLATDRFRGLASGKGPTYVAQALIKMNALRADGVISDYTARGVARLGKLISDDSGSFDISELWKGLQEVKNKMLGNRPLKSVEFETPEDVVRMMSAMSSGKSSIKGMINRSTGIGMGESSPIDLGVIINKPWSKIKESTGWGQGEAAKKKQGEFNLVKEALSVPSALTTTGDVSAPGRQGLALINTPQFWKAAYAMFGGFTEEGFNRIDAQLRSKPLMQRPIDLETGKVGKSIGERIGTKLYSPASRPGPRAESVASRWLEMGIGEGPGSKLYRNTLGAPIRATNRMYITFLNHLNVNRTEFLMNKLRDASIEALDTGKARPGIFKQSFTPQEAIDLNPYQNLVRGKEIADFVNTATGHGPLKTHLLPHRSTEVSLESAASKLGHVFFSPGLLASRLRMLNPSTYIMATPFARKQYVKAALSTAAAWYAFNKLAEMGGGELNNDPTSADFGKVRIGDTRIDPGGGFAQFAVLYSRLYEGGYTSSSSGEYHEFGKGYQPETQWSNLERFGANKLNPVAKFAYDVAHSSEYNPFHAGDRTLQLFVPLFAQDVLGVLSEDPEMAPWLVPMAFGVGSQTYSKGESVGKLINPENDWLITGGGVKDLIPGAPSIRPE